VQNQSLGLTYVQLGTDGEKEYLSYAGGNESTWTDDSRYFNRDCTNHLVIAHDKPCLCLIEKPPSLDIWTIIENVQIPSSGPCGFYVFLYHAFTNLQNANIPIFNHSYFEGFDLKVSMALQIPNIDRDYMQKSIVIYDYEISAKKR